MKILYNHRTQARGAEGTHITKIICGLQELGHEVEILGPPGIDSMSNANSAPVDKAQVKTKGIATLWKSLSKSAPQFVFEFAEIAYNASLYLRMRRKLKQAKFDVVYERYAFFMIAGAVLAKHYQVPFVLEVNELSGVSVRSRPQFFQKLCRKFEEILLARCDLVLVVSSKLRELAEMRGVPASKIRVLPNALDPSALDTNVNRVSDIRARYRLNSETVIGCVGWFDKWDRLDFLISVFGIVASRHSNLRLMLIGDGPSILEAKSQSEHSGLNEIVTFTGAVEKSDVFNYMSILDIAILPHSNDYGSPVVLFELLGIGAAVIAPALPPILDVVTDNETALLFTPLDEENCAAALSKLIDDSALRASLSANAKRLVHAQHTWHENAQLIAREMQALLSN